MEINKRKKESNNIEKIKKYINIVLIILWMIIVFLFSSEIGTESSSTSGSLIRQILTFFKRDWNPIQLNQVEETLQPYIRKLAHFTLYTIGGFLIYNLNKKSKKIREFESINIYFNKYSLSLAFGMLYAIIDEIHQAFVPGRDGRVFDVCIDTCGISFGIIICKIKDKLLKKV